ncbi:SDR family NAD(P)-dependent oxidoreductase [Streptomyces viridosporus]|uniref:SDR family NAD(P)-dependent oxidoreductase n=1 Tax=Streptomyces viridosporus TaxID=67581 RepID=UPI003331605F
MSQHVPIAVIGMACRFPGADDHRQFWDVIRNDRSQVGEVPQARWDMGRGESAEACDEDAGRSPGRWAGLIDDVDAFDAQFFRLSPLEAESADPQQRIMLELAWSCLEDAAIAPSALSGRDVGVFIGSFNLDYKELQERQLREVAAHHSTGTIGAVIANRVSHFFDFHGPSVVVDTASSASLHALHLAVQSLQQGECSLALAGGINLVLTPARHTSFAKTGMLSPTGSCHPFDERADGYVRGEGGGTVLLKPLADAVHDGDHIYGVIKGSAVNHSGRTRTLTYPSDDAQAQVVADAIVRAGVSPETIGYVEAHGTGTPTGDPVEIEGLVEGFRRARGETADPREHNYCGLGSVKPNIGHLEAAAGIAGLIKVLLALEHRQLPALRDFQRLNPRIDLDGTPFHIVDRLREWKPLLSRAGEPLPRRASVSSFGIGGTNAHVVLEEAPTTAPADPQDRHAYLVCVSARTGTALRRRLRDVREWLDGDGAQADLNDLSATLLLGREHLDRRTALVVRDHDDLRAKLTLLLDTGRAGDCFHEPAGTPSDSEPAGAPRPADEVEFDLGTDLPVAEYRERLLDLAESFAEGHDHRWEALFTSFPGRRLRLPTYAFDRHRFWITPDAAEENAPTGTPASATGEEPESAIKQEGLVPDKTARTRRGERTDTDVRERVEADLRSLVSDVLKLSADEIHPRDRLSDLGCDSVGNTQLALRLSEHYGIDVAPSLFYGYFTLEMLRDRLLEEQYADTVVGKYAAADENTVDETAPAEGEASTVTRDESAPASRPATPPGADAGVDGDHRIAVIGMSGRFPQARTVDEFWQLLAEGREAVTPIPAHRLGNWAGVAGASEVRGGWIPGEAEFDPLFFEISPKEAEHMDPRQRLLLQESWRALEDAGYGAKQLRDNTMGMFVGAEQSDYPGLAEDEQTLTSGHDGILAARLSYFLDFSGPVLTVNTACSAGLAAVHQACLSLRSGECDTAVAAGVSLLAGPQFYEHATQAGMLSPDGVCYAFDKRANGMVMGEAIAAVVLKPLAKALADGDRVHAVITASGLNHDGRTNGITAPSQPAQVALLDSVYQRFGVEPADIEHVIAHGTGTRLGDPIEVNALTEAFGRHTDKTQYCALTSVKTNIGHTLATSGVVSLIALVQALRHRTVPASLHSEQESEYIDWTRSPFRVNKEARPWPPRPGRERTGAVSSFGISGTNVHVVVESHGDGSAGHPAVSRPSYLLALSAKTEEALRTRVADLLAFLRAGGADDVGLGRISSTLLAGRHHFAHRCALVAETPEDAERLLQQVLDGKKAPEVFRGLSGRDFRPQNALTEYGNELIGRVREGDRDARYRDAVRALADLYCQGYELAWENLFGDRPLPCVSLPGYPFARETYWVDSARSGRAAPPNTLPASTVLHPLLDSNISTLRSQRFAKHLSASEFFLRDHVVDGKILLPGVAHMEMAYTASRLATGSDSVTLRGIIWGRPIVMDGASRTVHIELTPLEQDALEFVLHDGTEGERTVFSQGRAGYAADRPTRPRGAIDIPAIKARCTTRRENAEIFASLRELGFGYGETFQAMETLYCGETEALARIVLGDGLEEEYPRFTLHPSLFDAALNALRGIGEQDGVLRIPFSLEELVVFAPIPRQSYCHATVHRIARDGTMSVDLAICDDSGIECVRLTGLVFKEFTADKSEKLHYYVPRWTDAETDAGSAREAESLGAGRTLLILDDEDTRGTRLGSQYAGRVVRLRSGNAFQESGPDLFTVDRRSAEDFDRLVRTLGERDLSPRAIVNFWPLTPDPSELTIELEGLLHLFRSVHRTGTEQEVQYLSVLPDRTGPQRAAAEALVGFGRAMTAVDHLFRVGSLEVADAADADAVAGSVLCELGRAEGSAPRGRHEIRHADGVRSERVLRPWTAEARSDASELPLKEGGVYLLSGGAGALGLHLGRYLARECRARLVLLGRREPDASLREEFAALEAAGAEVLYLACDVADRDGVSTALDAARERFGNLDGVFHGAGVMGGTGVLDVDWAEFEGVLAPKTHGTVHLDELTAEDPLDFFLVFSSIAAYVGDFGQGSYAAANRFLDGYVRHREELRAQGLRRGRSVSVNWPYWDEGGMLGELAEDGPAKTLYHDHSGMRGLRTEEGIGALLEILMSDETQVVVTKGERRKIEKVLRVAGAERAGAERAGAERAGVEPEPATVNEPVAVAKGVEPASVEDSGEMFTRTVEYLRDRLSQVFHIPKGRIDAAAELGEYGIESIQIMELMRLLTKDFDSLPGTLFFEYRTIQELAEYFTEYQAARLTDLLGPARSTAAASEAPAKSAPAAPVPPRPVTPQGRFAEVRTVAPDPDEAPSARWANGRGAGRPRDVAIIGMSGRYPKSRDLDEFWKVLERGQDCIEEIPPHRWDKDLYYAAEKTPGKSSSKWGGFIDGAENFDALFFNMSANQAALTDPQTRLFLQSAWEAMEDAGYTRKSLSPDKARKVGVYLGMMWNEYQLYSGEDVVLSDRAAASNVVSYFFDLHGQSLTVDTACSSSLYAIAMAVESIRNGSSSLAFAGGANLSLHPNKYVSLSQMNFFSEDGRCRSFGEGGTGYVPGEGVGCVLLKPFDQAVEDGDHIHGVIRGVATVHGGKTNGMTVPNPLAQADMVAAALADAGLSAEDISYVEGHGTGTALGDPIEITGLTRAFRKHTGRKQYCPIGSVKSNIGHLEGAAGVVAVTKVLLQMRHGMLVPSLHSEQLNSYIDFPNSPFYVQRELQPWERPTRMVDGVQRTLPRIAGVSSFGAHGAIAHVIIEEYQPGPERPTRPARVPRPELLVLSAKDDERLREKAQALLTWLAGPGQDADPADIAYTLQVGREAMEERLALIADGRDALCERLRAFLDGEQETANVFRGSVRQNKDAVTLLEADEEMRDLVQQWLAQGRHDKLANVWVKGLALDWMSLARDTEPLRISLPTYPFVQERHWLDAPPALALQPPRTVALAEPAAPPDRSAEERTRPLAFVEDWEPAPLDAGTGRAPRGIVFLCTGAERQEAIARAARELDPGLHTVFVGHGDTGRKTHPDRYEVRRGSAQDYLEAFRDIAAGPAPVDAVVSMEALEPGGADGDFGDVVLTVQAIAGSGLDVRRCMVAGQYRDGRERALLEAHLGFERSLGMVMPKLSLVAVLQDAADPLRPTDTAAWLTRLVAELRQERAVSALYHSGGRFVSRVREATLDENRSGALRHGGTYLITGGCGGLGMIVARHLAEHYAANLVLTGRSPWDETRQEALRGLAAGQRVLYVQADSCDADAMKQAVTQARERFGALHGVIHAAGVQGQGSVLDKDLRSFEDVLGPKIRGTLTLDEVLVGEELDLVCYFSSTAAVIGDFGTCDYAVGNRFQMSYARHRDAQVRAGRLSGRTVVVNWPLWREGGMGFDHDTTTMLLKSSGQDFLETADGIALFESLLSQQAAQHMILVGRPNRVSRFLGLTSPADVPAPPGTGAATVPPVRPTGVGGPASAPAPDVEERLAHDLRRIVSGAVGLSPDRLYEDDNLADYGFDSVSLAGLATALGEHWGVEVTPALFYSRSTLRKLREYFATEHKKLLAAFYLDQGVGGAVSGPTAAEPAPPRDEAIPADRPRAGAEPVQGAAGTPDADHGVGTPRNEDQDDDAIAVIGMSGRFPGADNPSELWSLLAEGRDAVSPVSHERLDLWGEPHDSPFGAFRVGQLSGPDEFDPLFFEISPNEARSLDPRQRLLLQESWRALEDAGWTPASTRRIGMFVGVEQGDYDTPDPEAGSVTANHDGILAARLSYLLDLSGPVMAINTACSSGLVAAHQACASIRADESDVALAAGVSLITTSQLLTRTRQAGMLSEDGVTYAFDRRANGMVLSEAVAVVVLKRLSAAVADGDRIHGIIRASGINYDGRSNGITAPNGDAQVALLRDTYRRHGIDPANIEYVVAHGTGTRLGDPVEVNALNDVFRGFTDKRRYCALTSVKPNVGHTLAASGLVSLIGVLQAMCHETIPGSLNCAQENEYIDWKDSPFFVNKTNRAWPQAAGRRRIAAISSFGMSGTNAHMVVESPPADGENEVTRMPVHLLALSAKSEESLRQRVTDLIDFLEDPGQPHDLPDIGATLLGGRPHFRHRCAVVARDAAEAVRLLRSWASDGDDPDVLTGEVPKGFTPNDAARQAGDRLLEEAAGAHHDDAGFRDALRAAAMAYCQGYDLAWNRLSGGRRTASVALPGYPFARKRLWRQGTKRPAPGGVFTAAPGRAAGTAGRFVTTLTGSESFLRDHVVAGEKILPGVAHLELARAAHAAQHNAPTVAVTFRDVVWLRPVRGGDTLLDLHVELEPDGVAGTRYRVLAPGVDGPVVHSQGRIEPGDGPAARPRLDLAALRTECGRYETTAGEMYLAYRRQGIAYGPSFQGVRRLLVGDAQVLAELALPEAPEHRPGGQVLPPGLLDAALQSSASLRHGGGLHLPYAVAAVEILGSCEPVMWAWLRSTTESGDAFDVDLCDAHGEVRVRFRGFRTRPLSTGAEAPPASERPAAGSPVLLEPRWEAAPLPQADGDGPLGRTLLVGTDPDELGSLLTGRGEDVDVLLLRADDTVDGLRERLARGGHYDGVVWVASGGATVLLESEDLITRQEEGVYAGFRLAKALLALGYDKRDLEWTALTVRSQGVVDTDRVDPTHAGVHGLLGSLSKENPRWRVRLADVEAVRDDVLRQALRLPVEPSGDSWANRGGSWFRQTLAPVAFDALPAEAVPYRRDRVYVVIGGAGGLGAVWTEHVVRTYGVQVVWIGRRAEDEAIRARIDALSQLGPAPWYLQADATDREALAAAVARIRARFPEINGVVHSALALLDQSVARMPEERFRAAVRAKVDISVRIAQVFADEPLDFVLFFSSTNSFQRSAGQSNYVCGCVFKDAFARLWRQSRPTTVKVMNWGYWGSVGVVASSGYQRRMERSGIGSIEPDEGMAALDLLLRGPYHQLAVEKTTAPRPAGDDTRPTDSGAPDDRLVQRVLADSGSARGFDDALLCELLLLQLQTLGMNRAGGSVADLRAALAPGGGYDRWLGESLRILAEHGYLEAGTERYTPTDRARLDGADAWRRWEAVCRASEGTNPYVNLLEPVIRELPEVLSGRRRATDVIFPQSSMSLVRGVYRDCESATALNELVAESVAARVEVLLARDPAHRVRVFEIGSGTGGTSEKVLRRLAQYRDSMAEYCYTDVSQYFLRNGRQEFGADHPYLRFELFDAERAPAEQGLDEGGYDIVIATNVLHATRDVRAAARHTRALLSADGTLVLNELATRTPFLHLTFGLLDGWWRYEDTELRIPGCPGLAPETWQQVLLESGFAAVSFPADAMHDAGHQIVVADAGERTGAHAPAPMGADDARERVRSVIVERLQTSLGLDRREISEEDSFADYGVDSILGVELTQQLSTDLSISLSVTDLFDHSSVRALAGYVVEHHLDASSPLLAAPVPAAVPTPVPEPPVLPAPVTVPAATGTPRPAVSATVPDPAGEPVAVIGMSGRFGTAKDTDQLWQHLADGRSLVGEISRWDMSAFVAPGAPHPRYASLMDDIDRFDPLFFQISGLEATYMDPQQRIALEEAWKALEDAGYAGDAIRGRSCGVYIGTQVSDYLPGSSADAPAQAMWGNAEAIIPARLSYLLDLQGPAIAVETACSGSLVALHLACQALRTGEVETALVGGVSVQCAPDYYLNAHKAGMLSETGQCHSFAEGADGFVPGEGVGVVMLKRLRDALADGDHIHGVIRGSGINQDGTSNGITAPSAKSQERLERQVYDTFGIDPAGIQLVEAHGTGTQLGDPIEFQALTRAFRHYTDRREYCAIGSVKTNIGHAAPASGMAGLIKILLALRHRELPRSLHFDKGNPHIDFEGSPFYVNTVHRPWTAEPGRPRRAALSSFGFSGTNAHVVVEEAPDLPRRDTAPVQDHLVVLSALSPEQLRTQAERLVEHLRRHPDTDLGDIASTLVRGRRHCPVRLACVARDTAHLVTLLGRWLADGGETEVRTADLTENAVSPQPALEQYGDSCLRKCAEGATGTARREHLEAVSALYLQGYQLRYERLFEGGTYRRVPLPTYPFQRQRHWLPPGDGSRPTVPARPAGRTPTPGPRADAAHLALAPVWVEEQAPEPGPGTSVPSGIVVVGGSAAERAALAAECPDAHFLADGSASTASLTEQLRGAGRVRDLVWISPAEAAAEPDELLRRTAVGVDAFFRLVKALFELGYGAEELTWTVVTRQTQPVRPGESVLPADAAVLGLVEVMAKELPNWSVGSFDLGQSDELPARTLLAAGATNVRALRDGQWFRRGLYRVELPAPARSPYKEGGVYVVLGGAGGIGRLWSEDMIRRYRAQIVWIGRREKDAVIQAEIDRLAALGRAPWYVRADAADRDSLRGAYARIQERFGTVHGVVQSVFGLVDQSLPNTTEQQFRQGLSAKIDASVCMAEVFDAEGLDFMLFFSSIASVNPTMGYCSYVAGNAFEDALARRLSGARPYAVKVVNWGYWGAVGSGLDVPEHVRERIYRREGLGDIDPVLAMDAVERLLAAPLGQIAYLNTSRPERFEGYTDREAIRVLDPAERRSDPLAPLLPSRQEQLRTVEARAKSKLRTLDELLLRLLWCALHGRGWIGTGTVDADSFRQAGGILGKYDRWASETLKLFARQGWLMAAGSEGSYRAVPDAIDPDATAAEWERSRREWLADPELRASVDLVDTTLRALPDVLTGAVPAVDVIFPGSSLDLVEGIYKRNMIADYFNDVVGDCVVTLVESRLAQDPEVRMRILEIGAGTGGTTATVMRRLQPYRRHVGEYCYTDLSKAFLIHGRREFGADHPFLRCEIFDAGRPVTEQGFDEGGYDLVIATNVLHATEEIRASLRNSKALLRSGGALVVNEIDGYTVFGMLTFALLDGWWPQNTDLREPGGPGLRPETWQSVLEWEGFEGVEFPARDAHPLGQQVVVGFSDGVIRRTGGEPRRCATEPFAGQLSEPVPVPISEPVPGAPSAGAPRVDGAVLGDAVRTYLKELVARTLLIPAESIDAREQLSAYGIDSILILQLLTGLKKDLGETSSTLFFEYRTIEALTEYFVTERGETVARALGVSPGPAAEQKTAVTVPRAVVPDAQAPAGPAPTPGPGRTQARPAPRSGRTGGVAIVGMSARFPQAETLDAFWSVLREGRNTVTEIPADRWALDGFYEPDKEEAVAKGRSYSKWGAFLDGFADFDPLFFEMTPNDALEIDPQERLFLQEAWRAFENAGYTRGRLEREHRSSVGVFVGITRAGHNLYGPERWRRGDTAQPYTSFGSAANRVSFKLNLNGPSMPIDTMCSSSMTALHEACEHLLHGDCELAVAGGVNLYLHPSSYVSLCGLQMLADGDECRSFGVGGNGFVPGEGVGALVLKRLEDAERDGDHIHAVIRGTSINHGGTTNGYTVPNPVAQGRVVRDALDRAGVDARTISYVEAHGTGTVLGDPIEINGLTRAFSQDTQDVRYCAIGSVKSNIGHAEAAAGIAGVFKAVLQMQHGELVPSLHADEINPHIDFDATPFVVQREGAEWKRLVVTVDGVSTEVPRRAGVSSFGAGGSNAHVVIEEYVRDQPAPGADRACEPAVVVLSAKDEERLREQASALLDSLPEAERRGATPTDVAYTLQVGREAMSERLGTVVSSFAELRDRLRAFLDQPDGGAAGLHRGRAARSDRAVTALTADADMSAVVGTWLAKGAYAKVLDLWVNGFELDWGSLHPAVAARIVPLPTYPFARERYWIAERPLDGRLPDAHPDAVDGEPKDCPPDPLIDDLLDEVVNGSLGVEAAAEHIRRSVLDGTGANTDNEGR